MRIQVKELTDALNSKGFWDLTPEQQKVRIDAKNAAEERLEKLNVKEGEASEEREINDFKLDLFDFESLHTSCDLSFDWKTK